MKTDPRAATPAGDSAAGNGEKKSISPLRRAGMVGLNLIFPITETKLIYRTGVLPAVGRLKLLRDMLRRPPVERESLNWEQAVARAGMPVEQLQAHFKRARAAWWFLMAVPGSLAILLFLMVLATYFNLPSGTLLRAGMATLVLAALGCVGFAKALVATYRLWQLESRRVSEEERGTFKDFITENRWCRQVLTQGILR